MASTDAIGFTRIILKHKPSYQIKKEDKKMGKIYYKKNGIEVGLELTSEEIVSCLEFIGSCVTTDHVDQLMKKLSELAGTATDEKTKEDLNKAADDLIKKMEEPLPLHTNISVKKVEADVDIYECRTTSIWENKFALVKAWLIDHGIEFKEKRNSAGTKEINYDLAMEQLAEMIDWLDDHGDEKFDTVIQV